MHTKLHQAVHLSLECDLIACLLSEMEKLQGMPLILPWLCETVPHHCASIVVREAC